MYNNGVLSLTDDESGRKMEILLAGNTGYLTGEWIEQTFLGTHVLICGDTQFKYHKGKVPILRLQEHRAEEIDLKQYELDRIVYFSSFLSLGAKTVGKSRLSTTFWSIAEDARSSSYILQMKTGKEIIRF